MKSIFTLFALACIAGTVSAQTPTITLLGEDTVHHQVCSDYIPAGATASDPVDGDITNAISMNNDLTDNCKRGIYYEVYTVKNTAGNTAEKTRVIIVDDYMAPLITLTTRDTIYIALHAPYTPEKPNVSDNYYEPSAISLMITNPGTVNTDVAGIYLEIWKAEDASGNITYKTRYVVVGDLSSIRSFASDLALNLYPNPVKEKLNISGFNNTSDISVDIYNTNGSAIMKRQLYGNIGDALEIDIAGMSPGLYFIRITTNEGQACLRFMKE